SHLRISGAAIAGRPDLPHPHLAMLGRHSCAGAGPAQDRDCHAMTDASDPIIRFTNVTKRFGTLTVLDKFDFTVAPGEKVTLIGPSGSGKSTVLRILMTLEPFQEGALELAGMSYHEPKGHGAFRAGERHLRQIRTH